MSKQAYDFVVVGAGSNNLTAAAYLAAGGHSVSNRHPPALSVGSEVLPRYRHQASHSGVSALTWTPGTSSVAGAG